MFIHKCFPLFQITISPSYHIDDENFSNIDKTKHPKKGEKKVQDSWTQVLAKKKKPPRGVDRKRNVNKSSIQTPQVQRIYQIKREEDHLKEHLN